MNRAEDAKYLAVVAGYYTLQKERCVRVEKFPVKTKRRFWIIGKKKKMIPKIAVELRLGPQQIDKLDMVEVK